MTKVQIFRRLRQICLSPLCTLLFLAFLFPGCEFYQEAHQYHRWHMQQIQRPWPDVSTDSCSEELYEHSETFVKLSDSEKGGYLDA